MAKFTGNGLNARIQRLPESIPVPVVVTQLNAVNPATLTVSAADIGKFKVGDAVTLANPPSGAASATGAQTISAINYSTRTITLSGLNGSGWTGGPFVNPAGMTITPARNVSTSALTGMTNAKPAVVTIAATDAALYVTGNLVKIEGTGVASIDGRVWRIGATTGTTFALLGSDTRANTASVTSGTITRIDPADMLLFCLTSFERAAEAADAIDVTTFCGAGSLAGTPSPGTLSIEGFVDFAEAAQTEWRRAIEDGATRAFSIDLKDNAGQIIYQATASGITETFTVNEASTLEGEAVLAFNPLYLVGELNPNP